MLNSSEHEILNAHKYKVSRNWAFGGSDKPKMLFFMFVNVKMPIIAANKMPIIIYERGIGSCSTEWGVNFFL